MAETKENEKRSTVGREKQTPNRGKRKRWLDTVVIAMATAKHHTAIDLNLITLLLMMMTALSADPKLFLE